MRVLGIDYSLNGTGLSIFDGTKIVYKKVFTHIKKNYELNKEVFILSPKFENSFEKMDWVCETIINTPNYDAVCMEDHIGCYYDWMDGYAILKYHLRKNKTPFISVAPRQLKKYAGCGNADKTQMSYFLRKDYNIDLDYIGDLANNIVDATWLAILGYSYFNHKNEPSNDRKKIVQELRKKYKT